MWNSGKWSSYKADMQNSSVKEDSYGYFSQLKKLHSNTDMRTGSKAGRQKAIMIYQLLFPQENRYAIY